MSRGVRLPGFDADDFRPQLTNGDAGTHSDDSTAPLCLDEKVFSRVREDRLHAPWTLRTKNTATGSKICAESQRSGQET